MNSKSELGFLFPLFPAAGAAKVIFGRRRKAPPGVAPAPPQQFTTSAPLPETTMPEPYEEAQFYQGDNRPQAPYFRQDDETPVLTQPTPAASNTNMLLLAGIAAAAAFFLLRKKPSRSKVSGKPAVRKGKIAKLGSVPGEPAEVVPEAQATETAEAPEPAVSGKRRGRPRKAVPV